MQALKPLFELLVLFHAVEASVIPVIERRRQAMERVLVRSLLRHAKPLMFKVTFQREEALLQLCRNIHRHSSLSTVPRKELGGNTSRGRGHTSRTYCMHSLSLESRSELWRYANESICIEMSIREGAKVTQHIRSEATTSAKDESPP